MRVDNIIDHQIGHPPVGRVRLPTKRIKPLYVAIATVAIAALLAAAKYGYNQHEFQGKFLTLSQIKNIECKNDASYYETDAKNGDAIASYCLAGMAKVGRGVEKSLEKARALYYSAVIQGLHLAGEELCRPSMFSDWSDIQKKSESAFLGPSGTICCPGKGICPWEEVYMDRYGDLSAYQKNNLLWFLEGLH